MQLAQAGIKVNRLVSGVVTRAHRSGFTVDLIPAPPSPDEDVSGGSEPAAIPSFALKAFLPLTHITRMAATEEVLAGALKVGDTIAALLVTRVRAGPEGEWPRITVGTKDLEATPGERSACLLLAGLGARCAQQPSTRCVGEGASRDADEGRLPTHETCAWVHMDALHVQVRLDVRRQPMTCVEHCRRPPPYPAHPRGPLPPGRRHAAGPAAGVRIGKCEEGALAAAG